MKMIGHSKYAWLLATLPLVGPSLSMAADTAQEDGSKKAVEVATTWLSSLLSGKADLVFKVSDVPFSWDRKALIKKREELAESIKGVVDNKGARDIKLGEASILKEAELLKKVYLGKEPNVVLVKVPIGGEAVLVLVRPGKKYRVVGFSD